MLVICEDQTRVGVKRKPIGLLKKDREPKAVLRLDRICGKADKLSIKRPNKMIQSRMKV